MDCKDTNLVVKPRCWKPLGKCANLEIIGFFADKHWKLIGQSIFPFLSLSTKHLFGRHSKTSFWPTENCNLINWVINIYSCVVSWWCVCMEPWRHWWGAGMMDLVIGLDNYWWPLLINPLCMRDCISFLVPCWLAALLCKRHMDHLRLLVVIYDFIFNFVQLRSIDLLH